MKRHFKILPLLFCALLIISCQEKKESDLLSENNKTKQPVVKPEPKFEYGFNLEDYDLVHDTVQSGDSFGKLLGNQGLSIQDIYKIGEEVKDSFDLAKIRAGKPYILVKPKDATDSLTAFIYKKDLVNYTVINFKDSIYAVNKKLPVSIKRKNISGYISSSLSQAMDDAGATQALIQNLSSLYQWKIDFFRLQKGDNFKLIYQEKYVNDTIYAGIDRIEAAEFTHQGSPYYAFRYENPKEDGKAEYYDDEANTLQSFFLKAPVKYTRISSRYSLKRFHPVQKRWKGHLGTDYAAPTGTPIHSTADGVVIASAYTRFNGNYVKVRHNSKYTTQYLHMSKRAATVGQRIKQGDVIGYVGQTGLATGPHVCYRFWVNGVQRDPYKEDMPTSEPLVENLRDDYFKKIEPLKQELEKIEVEQPVNEEQLAGF